MQSLFHEPDRGLDDPPPRRARVITPFGGRLAPLVQLAGLVATGWFIWLASGGRAHHYSWSSLISSAFLYAGLAWLWSAAITFGLYFAVPREDRGDVAWATLRTSATAVWFAPAIILFSNLSPAALAASLALVVSATRLMYSEWRLLHPLEPAPDAPDPAELFAAISVRPPLFLKALGPALGTAGCIHAAILAVLCGLPLLAGGLMAAAAATATVYAIAAGVLEPERRRGLPQAAFGVILTVLLSSGLTVGGLTHRVVRGGHLAWDVDPAPRHGLIDNVRAMLREVFYGEQPPAEHRAETEAARETVPKPDPLAPVAGAFPDGSFPGVVLMPEVSRVPRIVAPRPRSLVLSSGLSRPYGIPFGGQYWFFRWLYHRPPANSFVRRGTPASLSFSTTDHAPLSMEARQKFDEPIDLTCCSAVQIDIWNADRYPGTVKLDLYTVSPSEGTQMLGSAAVESVPQIRSDEVTAVGETLTFRLPAERPTGCTEFKVVFRRDASRADKSARVAIDRFVLVP